MIVLILDNLRSHIKDRCNSTSTANHRKFFNRERCLSLKLDNPTGIVEFSPGSFGVDNSTSIQRFKVGSEFATQRELWVCVFPVNLDQDLEKALY